MLAEEVGCCLPAAKLAAVTRDGSDGEIYGVVYRGNGVDQEVITIKSWLLRLSETAEGNFYWDDLVPCCRSCGELLTPMEGQKQCPVCKGRKGKGNCFHFACSSGSFRFGCDNLPLENPQTYCGSHPLFGGYTLPDQQVGDEGLPLWKETIDVSAQYSVSIAADPGQGVVVLSEEQRHARLYTRQYRGPSIIAESVSQTPGPFVSATTFDAWPRRCLWVQKASNQMVLWIIEGENPPSISEAAVNCPRECLEFKKKVVSLRKCLVAISASGLWVMDYPAELRSATVQELATKVSWRRVMDLPLDLRDFGYFSRFDRPQTLLAPGPEENQVMVFRTEGSHVKPGYLVELCGEPLGRETRVTEVTSTASVLWERQEVLFEQACGGPASEDCNLLPSVLRMKQRHAGYLFFDERGRVQHLRDEDILLEKDAWVAPSFAADPAQRIVTFKFPAERGVGRCCLSSVLMRYEYFQKAFDQWQEGVSAEVVVTDATTQMFDLLLAYFHTGTVGDLSLESLVGLMELGNKYLLSHLMALCMSKVLRLLAKRGCIQWQEADVMADLVIVASISSPCGPFKAKVLDFIVSLHPDLIRDTAFLSRISARSVDLLSQIMSSVLPRAELTAAKRRRIQDDRQKTLWEHERHAAPNWSAGSAMQERRLP